MKLIWILDIFFVLKLLIHLKATCWPHMSFKKNPITSCWRYFPYMSHFYYLRYHQHISSSVIRRKGKSQNGCFPKNKHFLPPDRHTYGCVSGGKKCSFFGKFGALCFLETPVLRFALLLHYRRIQLICHSELLLMWPFHPRLLIRSYHTRHWACLATPNQQ